MSDLAILNRFQKCGGDLYYLHRRFYALTKDAMLRAIELIRGGLDPAKAIAKARRECTAK